jgi:4-amino-4-deoxy-L-arabinose transferase-like glycosyltransferase
VHRIGHAGHRGYRLAAVVAVLWLILATRLALADNPAALDNIDAAGFDRLAQNLLAGRGLTMSAAAPFCPESVRTPAYPVFLAAVYAVFGHNLRLVFMIQGLLDLVAAAVVFRLSVAFWSKNRTAAGLLALLFYLVALSQWRFANELLSEGLLTPLLALSLFLFWLSARRRLFYALLTGAALGLAILCKPNYELAPLVFLAGCVVVPRLSFAARLRLGLTLVIGLIAVLAPWLLRNKRTFGGFFLSHTYDDNLARVSAVATLAEVNHEDVQPWSLRWEEIYGSLVSAAAAEYRWDNTQTPSCAAQDQRRGDVAAVALETVQAHPQAFVLSYVKGAARGLLPQEQFYWYERITGSALESATGWASKPPLALIMWAIWLVGYGLAYAGIVVGAFVLWPRHQMGRHLVIVMLGLLIFGLILPGPLSYIRFRVPVAPEMVVLQTVGLLQLVYLGRKLVLKRWQFH